MTAVKIEDPWLQRCLGTLDRLLTPEQQHDLEVYYGTVDQAHREWRSKHDASVRPAHKSLDAKLFEAKQMTERRMSGIMSAAGKRAICDALGVSFERLKTLTLTIDNQGVHAVAEYLMTDEVAERAADVLRAMHKRDANDAAQ